jgi:hypothetical protein
MSGTGSYKDDPGYDFHHNEAYLCYTRSGFKTKEEVEEALREVKRADAISRQVLQEKMDALEEKFMPEITKNKEIIKFLRDACDSINKGSAVKKQGECLVHINDLTDSAEEKLMEAERNGMDKEDLDRVKAFLKDKFYPAFVALEQSVGT